MCIEKQKRKSINFFYLQENIMGQYVSIVKT